MDARLRCPQLLGGARICSAGYKRGCKELPLASCVGSSQMCTSSQMWAASGERAWQTPRVEMGDPPQPRAVQLKGAGGPGTFWEQTRHLPGWELELEESGPRAATCLGYLPTTRLSLSPPQKNQQGYFWLISNTDLHARLADQAACCFPGTIGEELAPWRLPGTMKELGPALALG